MRNSKPQCFHVSGQYSTGNQKLQENIYLKPEESPEDKWFCILNNMGLPYDIEILSGLSFLGSKFCNVSINSIKGMLLSE